MDSKEQHVCTFCSYSTTSTKRFANHQASKHGQKTSDVKIATMEASINLLMQHVFRKNNHMNAFGFETTYHITKDYLQTYWEHPMQCIVKVITELYFNDHFKENQTIRLDDTEYYICKSHSKWIKMSKHILIPKLIERSMDIVTFVGCDDTPKKLLEYVQEYYDNSEITEALNEEVENLLTIKFIKP